MNRRRSSSTNPRYHSPGLATAMRQFPTVDRLYDSEDQMEGFRAFAEKRDPVWRGR